MCDGTEPPVEQIELESGGLDGLEGDASGIVGVYVKTWTVVNTRLPGPFSTCKPAKPTAVAYFRLEVTSEKYGVLSVTIDTFDETGNFPGRRTEVIRGEVPINPGSTVRLPNPGGRSTVIFDRAVIKAGARQMTARFTAPYTASQNGKACYEGSLTFNRSFDLTRVALTADQDDARFE